MTTYTDDDGMVVLRARLDPEAGALVCKALEAAEEELYQKGIKDPRGQVVPIDLALGR